LGFNEPVVKIREYREADAEKWDAFLSSSAQGTFLHSRRFLAYHGNRFIDRSLLFEGEDGSLQAVFPAAECAEDSRKVVTHPGATYGGLVHLPRTSPAQIHTMLVQLRQFLGAIGYRSLLYKSVPPPVQQTCVQGDVHALWREGAALVRRDLWNSVTLGTSMHSSPGHPRDARRARASGLTAELLEGERAYAAFHSMLTEVLARHGAEPVHTPQEMLELRRRLGDQVQLWGCMAPDRELVAGVWLFRLHSACWHTQYQASGLRGRASCALDLLLETLAAQASEQGVRFLTLGASTSAQGRTLNSGLFAFKAGVGAGSVVHDFYELPLNPP